MLSNLWGNKDFFVYFIYAAVFIVILSKACGVSNLLRFVFRYLKIGYSDKKMKILDDKWFDIQLFKIINGINTTNINDARLIQKGLNEGRLKPSLFLFTSSWGDITIKMPLSKITFGCIAGVTYFLMGAYAWHQQTAIVDGFAKVDYTEFTYYLSKEKLIITSRNASVDKATVHSKEDCLNGEKIAPPDSMFAIACSKLLDNSVSYQWWLEKEIDSVNNSKNNLRALAYIYCTLSVLWLFSLY